MSTVWTLQSLLQRPCSSRFALAVSRLAQIRDLSTSRGLFQVKESQPQTVAAENIELDAPATYISTSHDPWFNLSYEDWLLRNTPHNQPVLFIYRNAGHVVIGRNQCPWKETTPRLLQSRGTALVRRRSGGGAVYHDMGNTNFCIILPRLLFTRAHGAELVARAVRERLGIPQCIVNQRNDIIIRDGDKDFKVSGSAYKIIQHRAYHHGTMLISSDLSQLGRNLHSDSPNIETKGVESFRSPVTTLNRYLPPGRAELDHDDFVDAVVAEMEKVYASPEKPATMTVIDEQEVTESKVWSGVQELKSWDWTYGQSPEFTNVLDLKTPGAAIHIQMSSKRGVLTHFACSGDESSGDSDVDWEAFSKAFIGHRYETLDSIDTADLALISGLSAQTAQEIVSALRAQM